MDLFANHFDKAKNLLPYDGIVNYYGKILTNNDADFYLQYLLNNIEWENDKLIIFGKQIITNRKVAWYGDEHYKYTYSNTTKKALIWTNELKELKNITEEKTGEKFNSCLLNLYHSGVEGMSWHSDDEKELGENCTIGSLSFGAERKFVFKHKKSKYKIELILHHGSLLLMKGKTQSNWMHSLPKSKKIFDSRINLTFRKFILETD